MPSNSTISPSWWFGGRINQILALIPAYNESGAIAQVVKGARQCLPVLVVDDGSADDTALLAEKAGASVLRQVPNQGKGAALKAGFRWAIDQGYQAVVTLDADGQHNPVEIPKFLSLHNENPADLIIGERDFGKMPPVRRLANWLGRITLSWALGTPVPDNQSGYRLISSRLMAAMLDSQEGGFEYEVEMVAVCVRNGYSLAWVPIQTIYAGETSHIDPAHHVKHYLRMVLKIRRMRRP